MSGLTSLTNLVTIFVTVDNLRESLLTIFNFTFNHICFKKTRTFARRHILKLHNHLCSAKIICHLLTFYNYLTLALPRTILESKMNHDAKSKRCIAANERLLSQKFITLSKVTTIYDVLFLMS